MGPWSRHASRHAGTRVAASCALLAVVGLGGCARGARPVGALRPIRPVERLQPAARPDAQPAGQRVFQLDLDNDIVVGDDDSYTNGMALAWTGQDVDPAGPGFFAGVVDTASGLPGMDARPNHATLTFGQEMYTPRDILAQNAPPDQQPYAGLLFAEVGAHAADAGDRLSYTVRLGVVGENSGAEYVQRKTHELLDIDIPQGWDDQLDTEVILNLYVDRSWRHALVGEGEEAHVDITGHAGAALGTWSTGASAGVTLRGGNRLPAAYTEESRRSGLDSGLVVHGPHGERETLYGLLDVAVRGVARWLPLDGNTFSSSPSVDKKPFVGTVHAALVCGYDSWQLSVSATASTDLYEGQPGVSRFGTVSFTCWY